MKTPTPFNINFPETDLAHIIQEARRKKRIKNELVQFLSLRHPVYSGKSTQEVNRMRAHILASFEHMELPQKAILFTLEELENSLDPYMVAAASKSVRSLKSVPVELMACLQKAIYNVAHNDDAVTFETYLPFFPLDTYTTALQEILLTFQWLKGRAAESIPFLTDLYHNRLFTINEKIKQLTMETITIIKKDISITTYTCCQLKDTLTKHPPGTLESVLQLKLEDQEENELHLKDFFGSSPVVIAFFYTRCDNVNKCRLTISRLAQLQQLLTKLQLTEVKIAAITYDSLYDHPERMNAFITSCGIQPTDTVKSFRVLHNNFTLLNDYLQLQVNFGSSIINQHRIELFIVDEKVKVVKQFSGLQWNPMQVADFIVGYFYNPKRKSRFSRMKKIPALILPTFIPFILTLLPKCPFCLVAYLSAFGISGISWLSEPAFQLGIAALLIINILVLFYRGKRTHFYFPFLLSLSGAILFFCKRVLLLDNAVGYVGIFLILLAAFVNAIPLNFIRKYSRKTIQQKHVNADPV